MNPSVKIFSGNASAPLAGAIARSFGKKMGDCKIQKFSDGEFQPIFQESIRGDYVFLCKAPTRPRTI